MYLKQFCHYLLVFTLVLLFSACGDSDPADRQQAADTRKTEPAPKQAAAPDAGLTAPEPAVVPMEKQAGPDTDTGEMADIPATTPETAMTEAMENGVVYQDEIYKNWPYTEAPTAATESPVTEIIEEKAETAKAMVEEKVTEVKQEVEALVAPVADISQDTPPAETASEEVATSAAPIDGRNIYNTYCAICHKLGMNAAPKYGSKPLWAKRIAQGREAVYANSINGLRGMPPRGGFSNLSDDEVKAGVDYMVRGSGGWGDK